MGGNDPFHKLGGLQAVSRIALALYDRVLESRRLEPFFAGVDMRRLIEHQAHFLGSIMGGPESHTNEQLREVHARLSIDPESFREMLDRFREVLELQHLEPGDIEAVMAELEKRKTCIVTKRKRPRSRVA
jgi:hemoglobin